MNPTFAPTLAWLTDFEPAFGGQIELALEPRLDDPAIPTLDYGGSLPAPQMIPLQPTVSTDDTWRQTVAGALKNAACQVCFANLILIPMRSLRADIDGQPVLDGAAFLAEILKSSRAGTVVVALLPAGTLTNQGTARLRTWLAKAHRVEWIIYMGPEAASLLGAHPQFAFALLVIRSGPRSSKTPTILRLVNLSDCPRSD